MKIIYRDAGPADAEALASLGRRTFVEAFGHLYAQADLDLFLENHSAARWRAELEDCRYAVRLAEADDGPVGYAKLGPPKLPFQPLEPAGEVRQFYVLKPWQGAGVAREMMGWCISEAVRRGFAELYLSVFVDNTRARRFYERHGFEIVCTHSFVVGTHADEDYVMRLRLEEPR